MGNIERAACLFALVFASTACASNAPVLTEDTLSGQSPDLRVSLRDLAQGFVAEVLPTGLECTDPHLDDLEHISFEEFVNTEKVFVPVTLETELTVADLDEPRWGVAGLGADGFVGVEVAGVAPNASEIFLTKRGLGTLARKVAADPEVEILYWTFGASGPNRADFYTVSASGEIDALFECSSNQAVLLNEAASRLPSEDVTIATLSAALDGDPASPLLAAAFSVLEDAEPEPVWEGYENDDYLEPGFVPAGDTGEQVLLSLQLPIGWDGDGSSSLSVCLRSKFGTYGCVATDLNQDDLNAGLLFPLWLGDETPIEVWIDRVSSNDESSDGDVGPLVQIGQINSDSILSGGGTIEGAYLIPVAVERIASDGEAALEQWLQEPSNTEPGASHIKVN